MTSTPERLSRKERRAQKKANRRTWPQRLVIAVNVLGIFAALTAAYFIRNSFGRIESIDRVELAGNLTPLSDNAEPGQRVLNVLLVGSDSSAGLDPDDPINTDRQGERNGDVIIIAHIDERDGTAALLSIPRDLWVPIAGRDREAKINSAFSVGGPAMLIDTIEQNFDIPINHYVNVDFAGFQGLVDALGEVNVWFEQPARDWNTRTNSSQTGFQMLERGCQALDGHTALAYVRSRYYQTQNDDGTWEGGIAEASDLNRIKRQQDFLRQVAVQAIASGSRNPFVFNGLVDAAVEHVTLDQELSPALLLDIGTAFRDFDSDNLQVYSLPSRFDWVGSASVLFVEEEPAAPLFELYRGASANDPRTVNAEIAYSSERASESEAMRAQLLSAGFADVPANPAPLDHAGIEIRHGASARDAAQVVAASLGEPAVLVEVSGLPGRTVIVALGSGDVANGTPGTTVPQDDGDLKETPAVSVDPDSDGDVGSGQPAENTSEKPQTGFSEATCGR